MKKPKKAVFWILLSLFFGFSLGLAYSVSASFIDENLFSKNFFSQSVNELKKITPLPNFINRANFAQTDFSVPQPPSPADIPAISVENPVYQEDILQRTINNLEHTLRSLKEFAEQNAPRVAAPQGTQELTITVPQPQGAAPAPQVVREIIHETVSQQAPVIQEIRLILPPAPAGYFGQYAQPSGGGSVTNVTNPVVKETVIQTTVDNSAVNDLNKSIQLQLADLQKVIAQSSVTLDDAHIPDDITASKYYPLVGGTLAGNLAAPNVYATTTLGVGTTTAYGQLAVDPLAGTVDFRTPAFVIQDSGSSTPSLYVDGGYGRVGIGTSSPYGQVSIEITGEPNNPNNEGLPAFVVSSRGTSTPAFYIASATGRVGIATATPADTFAVGGNSVFGGDVTVTGAIDLQGPCPACSQWTTTGSDIYYTTGNVAIGRTSPSTALDLVGTTTVSRGIAILGSQLYIGNGITATSSIYGQYGNLGFGSTTPYAQVAIESVQGVTGSTTPIFVVGDQGTSTIFGVNWAGVVGIGTATDNGAESVSGFGLSVATNTLINSTAGEALHITNAGSHLFVVQSGGNVGIGTSSLGTRLEVAGGGVFKGDLTNEGSHRATNLYATSTLGVGTTSPNGLAAIDVTSSANANTPAFIIQDSGTSTPSIYVEGGYGRVGIGTSSPMAQLAIEVGTNKQLSPAGVDNIPAFLVSSRGTSTPSFVVTNANEGRVGFGTSSPYGQVAIEVTGEPSNAGNEDAPAFVIDSRGTTTPFFYVRSANGNIGIGTRNPVNKLDVAGVVTASSTIYGTPGFFFGTQGRRNSDLPAVTAEDDSGAIAIGTDGLPVVAFRVGNAGFGSSIRIVKCGNASCSSGNIVSGKIYTGSPSSGFWSMAIGSDGMPFLSLYNAGPGLTILKCYSPDCSNFTLVGNPGGDTSDYGQESSVAIGTDGFPVIAYFRSTSGLLRFVKCNNLDCSSANSAVTVDDTATSDIGRYPSVTIGIDGFPIIAYGDTFDGAMRVAHCTDTACSASTLTTVDSTGNSDSNSIAIGADGFPIISYHASNTLKVAKCGNVACSSGNTITTVDNTVASVGNYTSIAIPSDGLPVIAYHDSTNSNLKVAKCGNAACSSGNTLTTADSTSGSGISINLVISPDGFPVIYHMVNSAPRVTKCVDPACSASSKTNVPSGGSFLGMKGGSPRSYGMPFQEIDAIALHNPTSFQPFSILQNNAERFTIATNSNIGIGSTTPWGTLSVEQVASRDINLPAFVVGDSGTSAPAFTILNGNNRVGIGTSSPMAQLAIEVGGKQLNPAGTDVVPAFLVSSRGTSTPFLVVNGTNGYVGIGTTSPSASPLSIDTRSISVNPATAAVTITVPDQNTIASGVGLLIDDPSTDGTANAAVLRFQNNGGSANIGLIGLERTSSGCGIITGCSAGVLALKGVNGLELGTSNTVAMRIGTNQHVGIGTAANTTISFPLVVSANGDTDTESTLALVDTVAADSVNLLFRRGSGPTTGGYLALSRAAGNGCGTTGCVADSMELESGKGVALVSGAAAANIVYLDPYGKFGFGTTTPFGQVSIEAVNGTVATGTPVFVVGDSGTSTPSIYVEGGYGRVGIGTSSPMAQLAIEVGTNKQLTPAGVDNIPAFLVSSRGTSTPSFVVTNANEGRVGFGTSSPYGQVAIEVTGEPTNNANEGLPAFVIASRGTSTPIFYVSNSNGTIGIGTSSPQASLAIDNVNTGNTFPALLIRASGSGQGNVAIAVDTDDLCKSGSIAAATCLLTDLAELYPTSEPVVGGDLIVFDGSNPVHVKKATYEDRDKLAGAISTAPAIVFEGPKIKVLSGQYESSGSSAPVALNGRIPVKVKLDNGPIHIGDPITISTTTPGVGVKAVESGKIIGYAIDSLETTSTTAPGVYDQVMVFANLTYWTNPKEINPNLLARIMDAIIEWLKNTVVAIKEIVTDKLTTKQLCIGETCVNEDQLKALLSQQPAPSSPPPSVPTPAPEPTPPADTEPPTITLNGLNPTEIEVGSLYSDMGAVVTDNVNPNLGYKVSLDGGPEIYPNDLVLDTSKAGEHTITYSTVDQAGNKGTATRTVTVKEPAPEPPPAPTPAP